MKRVLVVVFSLLLLFSLSNSFAEDNQYVVYDLHGFSVELPQCELKESMNNGYYLYQLFKDIEQPWNGYYYVVCGDISIEVDQDTAGIIYSTAMNALGYEDVQSSDYMVCGELAQLWNGNLLVGDNKLKSYGIIYAHKNRLICLVYADVMLTDEQKEEEILRAAGTLVPAFDKEVDTESNSDSKISSIDSENKEKTDSGASGKETAETNYTSVLGMSMDDFVRKYNAVPATLESPYKSLDKPALWTDFDGYQVAWFYPEKTSSIALLLLSKDHSASRSTKLGLDQIQIASFSDQEWLPLISVTKRCASIFVEDVLGVSVSSICIIDVLNYYYENNCKEKKYTSWRSLDDEQKLVLSFFYSDGYYFAIGSGSQFK